MLNPIWNILIKKKQKNERNKTQEVLSEMYFKSRDKFNKNCPNYFKQNPFFLLWYCFIKVMKHINHYFVRTLVHKFLITHTIHVFFLLHQFKREPFWTYLRHKRDVFREMTSQQYHQE